MNEATARIKINKLLEQACWRFFAEDGKPANILLESGASIRASDLDALGNDFEKTTKGYIDFLLLDDKGRPFFPFLISYLRSQFGIGFFTTHLLFWSFNLNCYRNNSETFPICRIMQSLIKRNKALVGRESLTPLNSGSQL